MVASWKGALVALNLTSVQLSKPYRHSVTIRYTARRYPLDSYQSVPAASEDRKPSSSSQLSLLSFHSIYTAPVPIFNSLCLFYHITQVFQDAVVNNR